MSHSKDIMVPNKSQTKEKRKSKKMDFDLNQAFQPYTQRKKDEKCEHAKSCPCRRKFSFNVFFFLLLFSFLRFTFLQSILYFFIILFYYCTCT